MFVERKLKDDPTFPRPYRFGDGPMPRRFWNLDEIEVWERTKVARSA